MSSELREIWTDAGGRAPAHWSFVRFEDLLASPKSIAVGVMYPGGHDESGVPLIKVSDVKNGAVVAEPDFRISELVNHEYRRTSLCGNELLITLVGNPGDCAIVDDSMAGWNAARALAVVRVKDPTIRPWLRYVLLSSTAKHLIDARLNTTVQKTLNLKDIRSLPIPIAHQAERNAIVETAAALENKINVNLQINQTLEQMAQAIFKSWFVDFEPVKAKIAALEAGRSEEDALLAAMQAISGKDEAELTSQQAEQPEQYAELRATAELFPSAMQDSEFGEIPEGWHQSTVGHEFDVTMGQSPPGDTYNEEGDGAPFFQGRRDFGERFPSNRVYCSAPKRMANEGDTLLSVRAPVGDTNIALTNCCIGRGLAALRHKSGCSSYTYYSIIQLGQALSSYDSEGTVFGSINQKNLRAIPVVAPAIDVLAAFTRTVGSIDELIRVNSEEASTLADTRDTLLPKLLSGELSVPCNRDEIECELVSTTPELE